MFLSVFLILGGLGFKMRLLWCGDTGVKLLKGRREMVYAAERKSRRATVAQSTKVVRLFVHWFSKRGGCEV